MDDWVKIDAVSLEFYSGEARLELDLVINNFGDNFKAKVLIQILEQAEKQLYESLADLFFTATSLENRENFILKNRVRKFAKKYKEAGFTVPNITKLEKACEEKLREKTRKMFIWL